MIIEIMKDGKYYGTLDNDDEKMIETAVATLERAEGFTWRATA